MMCILFLASKKNNFWQNYGILDLENFQVRLQYWVASLCNQLLPEFSSNQFETFHRCYKHIEDVHVPFSRQENHFWQNYGILDLDNFQVRLQFWVASLCNQLLPEFSSNQFETLHRCYKHIEDVHVFFFAHKNIIFDKITAILILTFQTLVSSIDWQCLGSWVRMGQGVRTGLGHGGITCVLQTQFSSFVVIW